MQRLMHVSHKVDEQTERVYCGKSGRSMRKNADTLHQNADYVVARTKFRVLDGVIACAAVRKIHEMPITALRVLLHEFLRLWIVMTIRFPVLYFVGPARNLLQS